MVSHNKLKSPVKLLSLMLIREFSHDPEFKQSMSQLVVGKHDRVKFSHSELELQTIEQSADVSLHSEKGPARVTAMQCITLNRMKKNAII